MTKTSLFGGSMQPPSPTHVVVPEQLNSHKNRVSANLEIIYEDNGVQIAEDNKMEDDD
jgi:hypothetical protein